MKNLEVAKKYEEYKIEMRRYFHENPELSNMEDKTVEKICGELDAMGIEYVVIPNRVDAIRYCIENAKTGDIIVLAGKGHEDYQEIRGVKYPMDERVLIQEILSEMLKGERNSL